METDFWNIKHDWREIDQDSALLFFLDANFSLVSCNASAQKILLTNCSNKTITFPHNCFWSPEKQQTFFLNEIENHTENSHFLLFEPNSTLSLPVQLTVEWIQIAGQEHLCLLMEWRLSAVDNDFFRRRAMARLLQQDLMKNKLRLVYQPQINVSNDSLYGVEALARWTSDELGEVTPDEFVRVAEEFGLVADLDLWVLRKAGEQWLNWRINGHIINQLAVNFSTLSFQHPDITNQIQSILTLFSIPYSSLVLEVTERFPMLPNEETAKIISDLYFRGVKISLDDFGSGHSNLKRLLKFPISHLKLDRYFVQHLPNDMSVNLIQIIISLAHKLDVTPIAEGVETKEQLAKLVALGYCVVQGFFYSPPLSSGDLEQWIKTRTSEFLS